MVDNPNNKIQTFILVFGCIAVLAVASLFYKLFAEVKERNLIQNPPATFKTFDYMDKAPFPDVEIAGPQGAMQLPRDLKGKLVILNLWATWCAPCIKELPELDRLERHYRSSDVVVLAVSIDLQASADTISGFLEKHGIGTVAAYHDYRAQLQRRLNVGRLPVTLIISPRGQILYKIEGIAAWTDPEVIEFIDQIRTVS